MPATLHTEKRKMVIEHLDILNFKNIPEASLDFSPGVNCLLGRNGMGKSNLLESIHFLCLARPMTSIPESALILHGEEMMSVGGRFLMDNGSEEKINIGIVAGKGKSLKRNGKEYDRISNHIGRFPIVSVTPRDNELIIGPAEERRRLMDMVISQANASYLKSLIRYNKSLESRNRMLRAGVKDLLLYESVESIMVETSAVVSDARREWVAEISPDIKRYYSEIAGGAEDVRVEYKSVLNDTGMEEELTRTRSKDIALGYTSSGVHRDDLLSSLNGYSLKRVGSQGQVKTFTIALRLAIFDYLKKSGGITPLLLLDDIFDKLDSSRVGRIMELVSRSTGFGQIFISDTNREHLDETLSHLSGPKQLMEVDNGMIRTI